MRYDNNRLVFSPSDLVVFLDSEFASWMDRWRIECAKESKGESGELPLPLGVKQKGLACRADEKDAEFDLIALMGMQHEATEHFGMEAYGKSPEGTDKGIVLW